MIADNVARIESQITQAAERSGRDAASITLVAVCKNKPVDLIIEVAAAGVHHFGENRIEEANPKLVEVAQRVKGSIIWHMVGHVQSRKARDVVSYLGTRRFALLHSLDDLAMAQRLARVVQETGGQPLSVLVQVNISGEDSKYGIAAHNWHSDSAQRTQAFELLHAVAALPQLDLQGLMTIAPIADHAEDVRPVFGSLREFRDAAQQSLGQPLPHLSMGMTDDFEVAIEEGATLVRIGRAIFGDR